MIAKVNGKLLSLLLKMILNLSNLTEEMEKRLSDQLRLVAPISKAKKLYFFMVQQSCLFYDCKSKR